LEKKTLPYLILVRLLAAIDSRRTGNAIRDPDKNVFGKAEKDATVFWGRYE